MDGGHFGTRNSIPINFPRNTELFSRQTMDRKSEDVTFSNLKNMIYVVHQNRALV